MASQDLCNATIPADTDVAGLGVIISFEITAWATIIIAIVPAIAALQADILSHFHNAPRWLHRPISRGTLEAVESILRALCDLQLLTGLSIVIAGLVTLSTASYYHQEIIVNLWWLTLNSFWVARIELDPIREISESLSSRHALYDESSVRSTVRSLAVIASAILGIFYQSWIQVAQDNGWDSDDGTRCFVYNDNSDPQSVWLWVAGLALYVISMILVLLPWSRGYMQKILELHARLQRILWKKFKNSTARNLSYSGSSMTRSLDRFRKIMTSAGLFILLTIFWLYQQFLSIWSLGVGWYPILLLAFVGFAAWTTADIVDLKLSNIHLVEGSELDWGFGQVLPMMLLGAICLQMLDAFSEAPSRRRHHKRDSPPLSPSKYSSQSNLPLTGLFATHNSGR